MAFTPEQDAAIHISDQNLIVSAGAGSGKTRVLVERYLNLLRLHPDWPLNALVAITFTREAALEMRDRVRQALENLLANAQGEQADHWSHLLAQMDSARIDTIHALCTDILRANAAEAGVDPAFVVLDEVNKRLLLEDVIEEALQALMREEDPALSLFDEYPAEDIRAALYDDDLLTADVRPIPDDAEEIFSAWQTQWLDELIGRVLALSQDETFIAATNWQPPGGAFPAEDKLGKIWLAVHAIAPHLFGDDPHVSYRALQRLAKEIDLRSGSAKNWGDKATVEEAKHHLRQLRELAQATLDAIGEEPGDLDRRAAQNLVLWKRLLMLVQVMLRDAKDDLGVLDFNDLEQRTALLLTRNAAVRDRYRGRAFQHLLVDEFQDTNADQWRIVSALADVNDGGSLFVVGDVKQSIYGFRGADVSVFGAVRQQIVGQPAGREIALNRSFRSHPALVTALNALFERILIRDPQSPVAAYEVAAAAMEAHREDVPPYPPLEILLLDKKRDEDELGVRTWEAYEVGRRLQRMVDEGWPVLDKATGEPRPVQYGDMAVLIQSSRQLPRYEDVFKALGLPYVTVSGTGFYHRQEIWDVLNALKALHNPADDLALATTLRSPLFGFSDDLLLALRRVRTQEQDADIMPLWEALVHVPAQPLSDFAELGLEEADLHQMRAAHALLDGLRGLAGRVSIADLLRELLAQTGYLALLTGLPDGVRRRRNVEKLISLAEASDILTLGTFTRYLDDLSVQEVREGEALLESAGAIRLMSVHASKGLEFPVVALVDTSWQRRRTERPPALVDRVQGLACRAYDASKRELADGYHYARANRLREGRERAERRRLLYVAATRTRDHLLISGQVSQTKRDPSWRTNKDSWLDWLLDALDLRELEGDGDISLRDASGDATVRVSLPETPPDPALLLAAETMSDWQPDDAHVPAAAPPNLGAVPPQPREAPRHLAATQLADLGAAFFASPDERAIYRQRFRRAVLQQAPNEVPTVTNAQTPRISARRVGEIVHEALHYWRFPDSHAAMDALLDSYAWQNGLSDEDEIQTAIKDARQMLIQFQQSQVYQWVEAARRAGRPVYAELPFIYRLMSRQGERIIHGVMDLLLQRDDGSWAVVDYKTNAIPDRQHDAKAMQDHARRYTLQLGLYAQAAAEQLGGIVPETYLHYLRHNRTLKLPQATWEADLAQIDRYLAQAIVSA